MGMTKICLSMIVRDEAKVIRRCLDSLKHLIDEWVIVDTGSQDETCAIIRETMAGIPGELCQRPWVDFAHNRNEALRIARDHATCDYLLIIDADDMLVEHGPLPELTADAYAVRIGDAAESWPRLQLLKRTAPWAYRGHIHEFLEATGPVVYDLQKPLDAISMVTRADGARSSNPEKHARDIATLELAIVKDPELAPRYTFYLAQSQRLAGRTIDALATYERRATMGGFAEEAWYSLYEAALIRMRNGHDAPVVTGAFLRAFQFRPDRVEPLYQLARFHRGRGEHALAYLYAAAGAFAPIPKDILWVDPTIYGWRMLDELAVAASWLGRKFEAEVVNHRILRIAGLPDDVRARVEGNLPPPKEG